MGEITVHEKLHLFSGQVYSAAEIGMWCFNLEKELYYSTCSYEKEIETFLHLSGCLDYVLDHMKSIRKPIMLSDSIGLLWVAEFVYNDEGIMFLVVMGPMFCADSSVKTIEESVRKMEFPLSVRKQMMRILSNVPVVSMSMINQYTRMLHFTITEETIRPGDVLYQDSELETGMDQEILKSKKEASSAEREMLGEQIMLQAVSEGNLEFPKIMDDEMDFNGKLICNTGNPLRDAKNTVIIFTALCRRAAIKGGLSNKVAKEMEGDFIVEIERCETITKLTNLNMYMLNSYVTQVRKYKTNPQISKEVQECCAYIKGNILEPLTLEGIAAETGYTGYYLTKKFNKEMGIRLVDYIKQARVEYAKISLITTKRSIQEISDQLHFGTRNYFSKVFRELVGMTPLEYRERTQVEREEQK